MQRLTREEFVERFPLIVPAHAIRGIYKETVVIDRDAEFGGIVEGDVVVQSGARVIGRGIVTGNLTVEAGAVLYYDGIVKGNLTVKGAACLMGIFESFEADAAAVLSIHADSKIKRDSSS